MDPTIIAGIALLACIMITSIICLVVLYIYKDDIFVDEDKTTSTAAAKTAKTAKTADTATTAATAPAATAPAAAATAPAAAATAPAAAAAEMLPNGVYTLRGGRGAKLCADEGNRVICNRDTIGAWEKFTINKEGDKYSLRGGRNGKLCADEGNKIVCNRDAVQGWEKFTVEKHGDKFSLKGGRNQKYCADDSHTVQCNRDAVQGWEKFTLTPISTVTEAKKKTVNVQMCNPWREITCPGPKNGSELTCDEWRDCRQTNGNANPCSTDKYYKKCGW